VLGERWNGVNGGVFRVLKKPAEVAGEAVVEFAAVPGLSSPAFSRCSGCPSVSHWCSPSPETKPQNHKNTKKEKGKKEKEKKRTIIPIQHGSDQLEHLIFLLVTTLNAYKLQEHVCDQLLIDFIFGIVTF
jgi:predicted nicotinamide N-methyase